MKKLLLSTCFACLSGLLAAQAAYILPSPTDANEEITLYIDISLSTDGTSNNALKSMLTDHPDDDVYLWTWNPAGPAHDGGNGEWGDSNELNKLEKIAPMLYSISFIPTEFYGVDGATLFANGISCLAKLKDGNAYADDGYNGEAKTEDLIVEVIPKLCDRRICIFPEIRQEDDFVSITYDNTQEGNPGLQNMGMDDCYIFMIASTDEFFFFNYEVSPLADVTNNPDLKMTALMGDDQGKFRFTFIPEDLFTTIPDGDSIKVIRFVVARPGFTYPPGSLPYEVLSILECE